MKKNSDKAPRKKKPLINLRKNSVINHEKNSARETVKEVEAVL